MHDLLAGRQQIDDLWLTKRATLPLRVASTHHLPSPAAFVSRNITPRRQQYHQAVTPYLHPLS
jgi:hypothetical protein